MCRFVNMYSPKIKVVDNSQEKTWVYKNKYSVSETLKEKFDNVIVNDFTLNNPTLRELLNRIMNLADSIAYVKDNVIYALNISEKGDYFELDDEHFNFINGVMTSDSYVNSLVRDYSEAIPNQNAHLVEYLGFRNSNTPLMTFNNMKLETRFPIYKINSLKICYYRKKT